MRTVLLVLSLLFVPQLQAETALQYPTGVTRNAASVAFPVAFGSAGSELFTGVTLKSNVTLNNTSAGVVAVSVRTTAANCTGGTDDLYIMPNGGSTTLPDVKLNSKICIRSTTGSTITSGSVYGVTWRWEP